jgi:predicted DNA-binding transcriptional regulator AlpA
MKTKKTLRDFDTLPNAAGVSVEVVAALLECSNSTVWNRTKRGDLPQPIVIAGHTRWNVGALRKLLMPEAM